MPTPFTFGFLEGLRPDPDLKLWEWADRYRVLTPESSAEPGPWRTSRLPYMYGVMEALSNSDHCQEVVVMKGAQLGFSEVGNCWMGYLIHISPGPIMVVQASLEAAKNFSRQRIDPMIKSCQPLAERISENKAKDASNTMTVKTFPGGLMLCVGANSPIGLRSSPISRLMLDEIDGYPADLSGEGNPIELAEARTRTFPRRKVYKLSTPTVAGKSNIEKEYENSNKQRFFVPCPICEYMQVLEWERIRYESSDIDLTTHYECIDCHGKIFNHQKTWMLERGKWVADRPEITAVKGFHISSLYSPVGWFSWSDMAKKFEKVKESNEDLKGFYNTLLGLTFRETGEVPDYRRLYERRENFKPGILPPGAIVCTAGIDVQKDRVEVHTVGWGKDKQRWVIDYRVIMGDVELGEVWDDLEAYLETTIRVSGSDMETKISAFSIDAGFATNQVSAFCKRFPRSRCFPVKGQTGLLQFIGTPRQGEVTVRGKKIPSGLRIWPLGVDHEKASLYRKLNFLMPEDGQPFPKGFIHFPKSCDLNYFKGLCSEELKTKFINGHAKFFWEKIFDRNEQLDTMVYAYSAMVIKGYERASEETWNTLAMDLGVTFEEKADEDPLRIEVVELAKPKKEQISVAQAPGAKPRRKSQFWG